MFSGMLKQIYLAPFTDLFSRRGIFVTGCLIFGTARLSFSVVPVVVAGNSSVSKSEMSLSLFCRIDFRVGLSVAGRTGGCRFGDGVCKEHR